MPLGARTFPAFFAFIATLITHEAHAEAERPDTALAPLLFAPAHGPGLGKSAAEAPPPFVRRRQAIAFLRGLDDSPALSLDLFGSRSVAVRLRSSRRADGGLEWRGRLREDPASSVLLVSRGLDLVGKVETGGRLFEIRRPAGSGHALEEVDLDALRAAFPVLPDDGMRLRPAEPYAGGRDFKAPTAPATAGIDVMVLYDQAVLDRRPDVEAFIHAMNDDANEAFARSRVGISMRLVHVGRVERGLAHTGADMLRRAADDWKIAALRERHGADLVCIYVADRDPATGSSGRAEIDGAFSLVAVETALSLRTHVHELGHNLGALHNREDAFLAGSAPPPGTYNYGHRDFERRFITIMAYQGGCRGCERINNFSNPDVDHAGAPTGVAGEADNARMLRENMGRVAAWMAVADSGEPYIPSRSRGFAARRRAEGPPIAGASRLDGREVRPGRGLHVLRVSGPGRILQVTLDTAP